MGTAGWIVIGAIVGLIVIVLLVVAAMYNGLVKLRLQVKNAWAQIDVQLKRRHDLIPNLVDTVKGYMKFEKETLEKVIQARSAAVGAVGQGPKAQGAAEGALNTALRGFYAVMENYPELKANQNVSQLQEELTSTENKIAFSRQFYNDTVMRYNTKCQTVPTNIVAGMFNFEQAEFFELEDEAQREVPKVDLSVN
ncbi:MAG: LemA family protein [Planctomycetes bacterium]|nr:LemA family protein [Planctomycetota bacterium]